MELWLGETDDRWVSWGDQSDAPHLLLASSLNFSLLIQTNKNLFLLPLTSYAQPPFTLFL